MGTIAIITARSGSKGLRNKNIIDFMGKPLMAWTIIAAKESGVFDEIMVSTDSAEYKEVAEKYGASVPFLRSDNNSSDTASSWDVVREVLQNYDSMFGRKFDFFCLLQPTSPLRTACNISEAFELLSVKNANSIVSVCEAEHPISSYNVLPENCSLDGFYDSNKSGRRQDAVKYYRINGAIYIQKVDDVLECKNIYGAKSYAYIMDKKSSIDIDDEYDLCVARALANLK